MTTTFFLVRHATHELVGRVLTGRTTGVFLAEQGHRQARDLAAHFARHGIKIVQSSPRERAVQTARPIASRSRLGWETVAALDEIDVGAWTGRSFKELDGDSAWQLWNRNRSRTRAPGGEAMTEVQNRFLRHLRDSRAQHRGERLVLVSHADVIKCALLHFLDMSLDAHDEIELAPASVSTLEVDDGGGRVVRINERVAG